MFFAVLPRLLLEFLLDIFYYPVWWYTGGLVYMVGAVGRVFSAGNSFLAPGLWLKNLFVPMFGQHDLQGRLVSFIIRLGNFLFRSFGLLLWSVIVLCLIVLWVFVPLFVLYMMIISLAA